MYIHVKPMTHLRYDCDMCHLAFPAYTFLVFLIIDYAKYLGFVFYLFFSSVFHINDMGSALCVKIDR
jgi:hypothetical protein